MKVPDLEDMIEEQISRLSSKLSKAESCICDACNRPLMEHHLVENEFFMFVCCYPDNQNQRFRSKTGMSPMEIMSIDEERER